MEYAGFWRRGAAATIDGIMFGTVQTLLTIAVFGGVLVGDIQQEDAGGTVILSNLVSIVAAWLYYALMESSAVQATIGKMLIGIIVTDVDGKRLSFGRASGRHFGKFISTFILMIGFIMAAFTERKQALHDIMAGCLVIRKPKPA